MLFDYFIMERKNKLSKKDKLILRIKDKPKDFTFEELETLLNILGYTKENNGKTSGSSVTFKSLGRRSIMLHKPHLRKELLSYQIKDIVLILEEEGLI